MAAGFARCCERKSESPEDPLAMGEHRERREELDGNVFDDDERSLSLGSWETNGSDPHLQQVPEQDGYLRPIEDERSNGIRAEALPGWYLQPGRADEEREDDLHEIRWGAFGFSDPARDLLR